MALSKFLDPKNDFAFRRIFGSVNNKDILIHFIMGAPEQQRRYLEQYKIVKRA
jgi:hypothetical protein|nr:Rpn family recombination-promoting nuclease/putative transposase [Wolbachia endosymbiont of Pentalonia nigronervosa]